MAEEITFTMIDPTKSDGEYMSATDPYRCVRLTPEGLENSLNFMQDGGEIMIRKPWIRVVFDYPLENAHTFQLHASNNQFFTRADLAVQIAHKYQEMYEEERDTTSLPEETISERAARQGHSRIGLMNRARTDGKYGIWGHELGDLVMHTVRYDDEQDVYSLGIDS